MVQRLPLPGARSWVLLRHVVDTVRRLFRPKLYAKNAADKLGLSPARLSRLTRGHELPSRRMIGLLARKLSEHGVPWGAIAAWVAASELEIIESERARHDYGRWIRGVRAPLPVRGAKRAVQI